MRHYTGIYQHEPQIRHERGGLRDYSPSKAEEVVIIEGFRVHAHCILCSGSLLVLPYELVAYVFDWMVVSIQLPPN